MATFSLNYFQFISFQYTVPITAFFFDGRKRSYFSFILVPLTIALSLSVSGLFSFKAMMVILIEAVGTILFCELIQVLNKLDVFAKYATSIMIINIITPIENQYKWNLVLTDQLSVFFFTNSNWFNHYYGIGLLLCKSNAKKRSCNGKIRIRNESR